MGVNTHTAARIYKGQKNGGFGEEAILAWEKFPYTGQSKTYNTDHQVPDSAGTATAMFSGVSLSSWLSPCNINGYIDSKIPTFI